MALTPLADRNTKNDMSANLARLRVAIGSSVASLVTVKAELLDYKAAMVANPALWTADEQAEVQALIAYAVAQVKTITA